MPLFLLLQLSSCTSVESYDSRCPTVTYVGRTTQKCKSSTSSSALGVIPFLASGYEHHGNDDAVFDSFVGGKCSMHLVLGNLFYDSIPNFVVGIKNEPF